MTTVSFQETMQKWVSWQLLEVLFVYDPAGGVLAQAQRTYAPPPAVSFLPLLLSPTSILIFNLSTLQKLYSCHLSLSLAVFRSFYSNHEVPFKGKRKHICF